MEDFLIQASKENMHIYDHITSLLYEMITL